MEENFTYTATKGHKDHGIHRTTGIIGHKYKKQRLKKSRVINFQIVNLNRNCLECKLYKSQEALIEEHNFPFKASTLFRISNLIYISTDQQYLQLEIIGLMFIEKKIRGLTRINFQYTGKFSDFHLVKMYT